MSFRFFFKGDSDKKQVRSKSAIRSSNKEPDDLYQVKNKKLPGNFAEEVFNLEMELERDVVDIGTINKLLELYAAAVEYYESVKDHRYLIFKNKMSALWVRGNVVDAMNRATSKGTGITEQGDLLKTQKKKEMEHKLMYAKQSNNNEAKTIIGESKQNLNNIDSIIKKEMDSQEIRIKQRLEERKRNNVQRTTSLPPQKPKAEEGSEIKKGDNNDGFSKQLKSKGSPISEKEEEKFNTPIKEQEGSSSKNNFKVLVPKRSEKNEPKDNSPKFGGNSQGKSSDFADERGNRMLATGQRNSKDTSNFEADMPKGKKNSIKNDFGKDLKKKELEGKISSITLQYENKKNECLEMINKRLKAQIDNLQIQLANKKEGNALIAKVMEKLQKELQAETSRIIQDHEERKNKDIEKLRAEYM